MVEYQDSLMVLAELSLASALSTSTSWLLELTLTLQLPTWSRSSNSQAVTPVPQLSRSYDLGHLIFTPRLVWCWKWWRVYARAAERRRRGISCTMARRLQCSDFADKEGRLLVCVEFGMVLFSSSRRPSSSIVALSLRSVARRKDR
jgi:hypothetical protein